VRCPTHPQPHIAGAIPRHATCWSAVGGAWRGGVLRAMGRSWGSPRPCRPHGHRGRHGGECGRAHGRQRPWGMSWRRPPSGRSCLSPLGGGLVSGSARGKTRAAGTIPWGIRRAPGRTSRRHGRVPGAWAPLAPHRKGPQHILVRQRLQEDVPPPWPWQVRVVAEAGCAANAPRRRRTPHKETEGCALPRPRTPSPPRWDLLHPLPQSRATVPPRGDGTSGRATQRRHEGPKNVQILVPYLLEAPIGAMRKLDTWRGGPHPGPPERGAPGPEARDERPSTGGGGTRGRAAYCTGMAA